MVQLSDLGDGVGFAGFEIRPVTPLPPPCDCKPDEGFPHAVDCASNAPREIAAGLFAIGGRMSTLMPSVELRGVFLGEIGRIPVEALKKLLTEERPAGE